MRFLFTLCAIPVFAANVNLAGVKSVYIMPMSNGIDQYLANRLQIDKIVVVTTDPNAADAVLTDAIGPAFEKKFADLYPPPKPEKPAETEKVAKEDKEESAKSSQEMPVAPEVRTSSFRKGRGVIFLVDRKNRQVVWSAHERPKNFSVQELDRVAKRLTDQLKREYAAK